MRMSIGLGPFRFYSSGRRRAALAHRRIVSHPMTSTAITTANRIALSTPTVT